MARQHTDSGRAFEVVQGEVEVVGHRWDGEGQVEEVEVSLTADDLREMLAALEA